MSAPLYVRDGSRFVVYDERAQHTPPIPVPVPGDPTAEFPVVERASGGWAVYAPRCPHGRFRGCSERGCPGPS